MEVSAKQVTGSWPPPEKRKEEINMKGDLPRINGVLTVTHACGHTQDISCYEDLMDRVVTKGRRTEQEAYNQMKDHMAYLGANLCPECYCRAKEANPKHKPVDPSLSPLQRAFEELSRSLK